MRYLPLLAACAAVQLGACASVYVRNDEAAAVRGQVPGIPFLAKVPDEILTTTYRQVTAFKVSLSVVPVVKAPAAAGETPKPVALVPETLLPATRGSAQALAALAAQLAAHPDGSSSAVALTTMMRLDAIAGEAARDFAVAANRLPVETLSNLRSQDIVVSAQRYYLSPQMPLIGSSTNTFKLAADGTLTEATVTADNKTAETVLSLLPVNALLTKRWIGSGSTGAGDEKTLQEAYKRSLDHKAPLPVENHYLLKVEQLATLHAVKARCRYDDRARGCRLPESLALSDMDRPFVACGSAGPAAPCGYHVEYSQALAGGGPAAKKDDETPAYGISGRITLPKDK